MSKSGVAVGEEEGIWIKCKRCDELPSEEKAVRNCGRVLRCVSRGRQAYFSNLYFMSASRSSSLMHLSL